MRRVGQEGNCCSFLLGTTARRTTRHLYRRGLPLLTPSRLTPPLKAPDFKISRAELAVIADFTEFQYKLLLLINEPLCDSGTRAEAIKIGIESAKSFLDSLCRYEVITRPVLEKNGDIAYLNTLFHKPDPREENR